MKEKDITIYDIAKKLQLSPATISRALNELKGTNKKTIDLVKSTAEKMGYRPNNAASNLRKSKTKTVGLIIPRVSMYFHSMVISGIQDIAYKMGYDLIISQSNDDVQMEKDLLNAMIRSRVDGLMISMTMFTKDYSIFEVFKKRNIPLVFFDRVPIDHDCSIPIIEGDDYRGGYLATEHLIKSGRKRIAHFTGPLCSSIYKCRYQGYKDALSAYGLEFFPELTIEHALTQQTAIDACEKLFNAPVLPDGLFSSNDTSAITAVQFARQRGILVPQQLSIVGYSNNPSTQLMSPPITSVDQNPYQIGNLAFKTLFEIINGEKMVPSRQVVNINLIERESSILL